MNALRRCRRAAAVTAMVALGPLGLAGSACAAIDCWIDAEHRQTGDQRPVTDAAVAPMRRALHDINALLHRQSELHELPRTRLRSSWQIGGQWTAPARAANFLLRDHRESMWTAGRCDVIAGADRLEPRATVVVSVNMPESFFATAAPELDDEQLRAWREVPVSGQLHGRTLYGGHMLVFTSNGRLPWVPVTTAEYLDFMQRHLERRRAEARSAEAAAQRAAEPDAQEAMLQRVAEGLRRTDPANAERLIAEIRAQHAASVAAAKAADAKRRARAGVDASPMDSMLARLHAFRAGLTPAQLASQARLGVDGLQPVEGAIERYPLLVKPDPQFPWDRAAPARAQMLMVSLRGGEAFEQPMQHVLQSLDLAGLEALVRPRR